MGLTMFLLGLLYAVLVGALIAASASAVVIVAIAVGLFFFQVVGSDKIAIATLGAREVSPSEEPQEEHGQAHAGLEPGVASECAAL